MTEFLKIHAEEVFDQSPNQNHFPMHMHEDYEIFCFLSGDAKYIVEGNIYPLHKGDFILLCPGESHRIQFQSQTTYKRMVLNFTPSQTPSPFLQRLLAPFHEHPLGRFNHYPSTDFSNTHRIHYMKKICTTSDSSTRFAYLTILLCEFEELFQEQLQFTDSAETNIYTDIVKYINQHLCEPLSLKQLCEQFFISESQLNRQFKSLIGLTVWEYITRKRLFLAKKRIENGENPTNIYLDCGFNDYTSFYRSYRSHFGIAPSKTGKNPLLRI